MRHFEQEELARRYNTYRPRVHGEVLALLGEHLGPRSKALDVACGTGHSTAPLRNLADHVVGCDVSAAMLTEARRAYPNLTFVVAPAEALPVGDGETDLTTVGFAFHWFDQSAFLREAVRVLKRGGRLVLYNLGFPGMMLGNEAYGVWHRDVYLVRYPNPTRHRSNVAQLLAEGDYALTPVGTHRLTMPVAFSALELRNYLTTQSNVSAALERGASLEATDAWLDAAIAPFYKQERERFEYIGKVQVLERV